MTTRDRILDAAADVMSRLGLARATTKEIARAAGFSEATLYKHFQDKEELFLSVLAERLPSLIATLKQLDERVGQDTVRANLEQVARAAGAFFQESFPMAASLFAEPTLLAAQREAIHRRGGGPHRANEALASYLRAEQQLGRIRSDANVEAAASLLLGACLDRAFLATFVGEDVVAQSFDEFAAELVGTLLVGVAT